MSFSANLVEIGFIMNDCWSVKKNKKYKENIVKCHFAGKLRHTTVYLDVKDSF